MRGSAPRPTAFQTHKTPTPSVMLGDEENAQWLVYYPARFINELR